MLAVLDSAGIPLPAAVDALVLVLAAANPGLAWLNGGLAVAGSLAGCLILFGIARRGGRMYLDERTRTGRAARFRAWFQQYGLVTIFVPAVVPIAPLPLKVFVISAGALGVRTSWFVLVVLAARLVRYFGLAFLGAQVGEHSLGYLKQHAWHLVGVALLMGGLLFLLVRSRRPAEKAA